MANGFDTDETSYAGDDPSFEGGSGVGYGSVSPSMPGGSDNDNALTPAQVKEEIYTQSGGTATNPFPNSFFSQLFGVENVSYVDQFGGGDVGLANIAQRRAINRDRYMNPLNDEGAIRPGLEGQLTRLGRVIEVDRPQTFGETMARSLFGFSPLGPMTSFLGTKEQAIAPNFMAEQGINYDPALDPNSAEYQGPQSMLGQLGRGIEQITFGGARPVTKGTRGILDLIQGQEAERAMGGYETFDGQKI